MTEQPEDRPPAAKAPNEGLNPATPNSGVSRRWRRTAGAAAVVAVLVIGNASVNAGAVNAGAVNAGAVNAGAVNAGAVNPVVNAGSAVAGSVSGGQATTVAVRSREQVTELAGAALHGEFKVINRDGSTQLRRWQSGSVDAIDKISMTVRSADGFDSTYLLGPGVSVTGIGLGDDVTVVGAGQSMPENG